MFDSKDPSVHCIVIGVQERRLQAGRDGGGGGRGEQEEMMRGDKGMTTYAWLRVVLAVVRCAI
jgi:hypothetical protein